MIRPVMKDPMFLAQKALPAGKEDKTAADDLVDTLKAHHEGCVGMALNMIGINKAVIAVDLGLSILVMYNPKIIQREKPYTAQEGCLSLAGTRQAVRYQEITVRYQDSSLKMHTGHFTGFAAQIIQHECDHLAGILI